MKAMKLMRVMKELKALKKAMKAMKDQAAVQQRRIDAQTLEILQLNNDTHDALALLHDRTRDLLNNYYTLLRSSREAEAELSRLSTSNAMSWDVITRLRRALDPSASGR
jgi:hypothetical protein